MKIEIEISGESSKCAGLFTYSALAKGEVCCGTWYLCLPLIYRNPQSTQYFKNVPYPQNKHYKYVYLYELDAM